MSGAGLSSGEGAPLVGVRVVDFTRGALASVSRMLADLGAEVVRVETRGGGEDRRAHPFVAGVSLAFAAANLGKTAVELDVTDSTDRARLEALMSGADIVIEDTEPGSPESDALDASGLAARRPELVVLSVSNFGQSTRYAAWQATTPVLLSLSGVIARSGIAGRPPLLPPGDLGFEVAIPQAALVALVAFYNRLHTGRGDHLDFSVLDAVSQALDPGFGMTGSASAGATPLALPRGRPPVGQAYPIIPCKDGFVRLCVLSPRQWQGLFEWMGRPDEFSDPVFNTLSARFQSPTLVPWITRFFADKARAQIEAEAHGFGVPAASLLPLAEAIESEHVRARRAFEPVALAPGLSARFPNGVLEIDGNRAVGARTVPAPSADLPDWTSASREATGGQAQVRPLEGLRVLDFGIIVVGGEQGRLLGDQGAEVIKIESLAYPDGARQLAGDNPISVNFAAGNRNKKSFGVNLRDPKGRALLLELAKQSDVVLSNFKPGTLQSLGLGPDVLLAANPRLIVADSSAFGAHGPWSQRLGYGPLVRAASGLTALWHYPDDPLSFSDSTTIYPDHIAARVGLIGVFALLIRRLRTGRGGAVSVSQSEVMMSHLSVQIASLALAQSGATACEPDRDAPWGMFPCAGDDQWCAITVRGDRDWTALCRTIQRPDLASDIELATRQGRDRARARIDAAVAEWTQSHSPREVMSSLQSADVPAGAMHRVTDLPGEPYYQDRNFFLPAKHPYLDGEFLVEARTTHAHHLPDPPAWPAPLMGEHTRSLAQSILGLSAAEIDQLVEQKVLEAPQYRAPAQSAQTDR